MAPTAPEQRQLLQKEHQRTPEQSHSVSQAAAASSSPATSLPRHRPGYARVPSISVIDEGVPRATTDLSQEDDISQAPRSSTPSHGLGISGSTSRPRRVSIQSLPREAFPDKSTPDQSTPGSAQPLISPPSSAGFSGSTRYDGSPEFNTSYAAAKHFGKQSMSSLHSSIQPSLYANSEAGLVSLRSRYDEWEPHENCRSRKMLKRNIGGWIAITILALAIFSTVFSGIFFGIAVRGPRYERMIHTNGPLTPSSAAFVTSLLAKLIELSHVTVLVAFIGQALARRAFKSKQARGVTLAEISMRAWIQQPGTMITQWESVRYAGISLLGFLSLLGALNSTLYTSAATALVQPQLKWPEWQDKVMQGLVKTQFANAKYIEDQCRTPIQENYDEDYSGSTCLQLEHAAMGFHNYFGFLGSWTETINNGTGSSEPSQRPKGFALLNDNTTITAPWVEQANVTALYDQYGYVVNNVSMAMPHPGVIKAAIEPKNGIMQPAELEGLGSYHIRASVVSPVVHALCVSTNETMLKPFVYELWGSNNTVDYYNWPNQLAYADPYLNGTAFDDIFHWGPAYGAAKWPPVFSRLPLPFNTVMNDTVGQAYGRDSIYFLGKGGDADNVGNPTNGENYALCQLKVSLTPFCSTRYNASSSGGHLEAVCSSPPVGNSTDPTDPLQFIRSVPDSYSSNDTLQKDWPSIAAEWGRSLALNDGGFDGNSSNARLLTQLILTSPYGSAQLNPALPSIAEALAVMAGCTLLESARDAPFTTFWNYTLPTMDPGQYQAFNASIRAQQYASGGTQAYQQAFFAPLFLVFAMNLGVLGYFLAHRDWYTDFSEPATLFSLAVNSPPSRELAGSCGGGPAGEEYKVLWRLGRDGEHVFVESVEVGSAPAEEEEEEGGSPKSLRRRGQRRLSEGFEMAMSPLRKAARGVVGI